MEENTFNLIEYWKRHSPRPEDQIPFGSVMKGLSTQYSAVEFKEETVGRWVVRSSIVSCTYTPNVLQFQLRGQKKAAEFSFAGVIAHADDERTGNLVPEGEILPPGLDSRKR